MTKSIFLGVCVMGSDLARCSTLFTCQILKSICCAKQIETHSCIPVLSEIIAMIVFSFGPALLLLAWLTTLRYCDHDSVT